MFYFLAAIFVDNFVIAWSLGLLLSCAFCGELTMILFF